MVGRTFAHYRIVQKIGEGGMGVVYIADDLRLRRRVALKAVKPDVAADPARRARLEREAQAAAALSHENIAAVHSFEIERDGTCAIVFEYVAGSNLRDMLGRDRVPAAILLSLGVQIAEGLDAAHRAGVVHRDLKPENVIVTPEGRAKLLDFGVARVLREPALQSTATRLTAPGALVGTISYAAPEQLTAGTIDARTDIFALGLVLYELAAGRPAFHGATPIATAAGILSAEAPPLDHTTAPAELERIVHKCLRKNPDERYQSAREVAADLRNLQADLGSGANRPAPAHVADQPGSRGPQTWWRLNNVFDIAVLAGGLVFMPRLRDAIGGSIGAAWYFPAMVLAAVVLSIRAFLFVIGLFDPPSLPRELQRTLRWLKTAEALMFCAVLVAAVLVASSAPSMAGFLIVITVGGSIAALFVEPVMVRRAFPQLVSDTAVSGAPMLRWRSALGAMQLLMTVPWFVAWYWMATQVANTGEALIKQQIWLPSVAILLALTVACWYGLSLTTGMIQGRSSVLRLYIRWYPLHLLIDVVSILLAVLIGLRAAGLGGGLPALLLAFVPVYQRRLAMMLLDQSGAPASPEAVR